MIVSESLNYAFVSTLKAGTNSLYQILQEHYQGVRYGGFHETNVSQIPHNWFLFTTCRNPYTRAVSIWWSTCMRGDDKYGFRTMVPQPDSFESFASWAAQVHPHLELFDGSQQALLKTQSDRHTGILFNRILKVESLSQDFAALPFVNSVVAQLEFLNPTQNVRKPAEHYLSQSAIRAVQEWMGDDFTNYQYSTEIPHEQKAA